MYAVLKDNLAGREKSWQCLERSIGGLSEALRRMISIEYVRKLEITKLPTQIHMMYKFLIQKIDDRGFDVHLKARQESLLSRGGVR